MLWWSHIQNLISCCAFHGIYWGKKLYVAWCNIYLYLGFHCTNNDRYRCCSFCCDFCTISKSVLASVLREENLFFFVIIETVYESIEPRFSTNSFAYSTIKKSCISWLDSKRKEWWWMLNRICLVQYYFIVVYFLALIV